MTTKRMNFYDKFLDFVNNFPKKIGDKVNEYQTVDDMYLLTEFILNVHQIYETFDWNIENDEIRKMYLEDYQLRQYHKNVERQNDINFEKKLGNFNIVIFDDFPIEEVKDLLQHFIDNRIYNQPIWMELVKFVYKHWNDDIIKNQVDEIKDTLIEVTNMSNVEYADILTNVKNPKYNGKKHYVYYVFWLYIFYPLFDNCEELLLKLVSIVYIDDAQDGLLDGLFYMDSNKLVKFYNKFLIAVHNSDKTQDISKFYFGRRCFELWSTGTGAFTQNVNIIKKLKNDIGYDIFTDELLLDFWNDDENKIEIEHIKKKLAE